MDPEKPKAVFVTFYSFKGGVGRSMALLNTAGILAGRGFRVLVIDLDLEAPGLSYLNPDAPDAIGSTETPPKRRPPQLGFVDLLINAKERNQEADLFALSVGEIARKYTQTFHLPAGLGEFSDGSLHIMPAGKFDDCYAQRFDSLNLRELYQEGLGEPLIRAFKKKFVEADLFDYVLVDSRTGFSDEAGICTRDLADYLMILSGLNRQNIEGTSEFLRSLRAATQGKKEFQIILSPVPNGEDALLDEREALAKVSFGEAWGSPIELSLQIPYHPQLSLTEEPHIFRRRHGYLFEAYRVIEKCMLRGLGHDVGSLMTVIQETLEQKDYPAVLRLLRRMTRLDNGKSALAGFAGRLVLSNQFSVRHKAEEEPKQEKMPFGELLNNEDGRKVIEFIVDNLPLEESEWGTRMFLQLLITNSIDLADRLFRRIVGANTKEANILGNYAVFLGTKRGDKEGAEIQYKRAIEADPAHAEILGNYAVFLETKRSDMDGAEAYYKRAIETDPTHGKNLANYADFLARQRGDKAGAEMYYKRAIEADPKHANNLGNYAVFLANQRGDKDGAEAYFRRAVEADPKHANNLCNYGQFLVGLGRFKEGEDRLLSAFRNFDPSKRGEMAEVCFSLWLVSRIQGCDAERWESYFKYLIQQGFERYPCNFDHLLQRAEQSLKPDEFEYAKALATAFLDKNKVADLEHYERWRTLAPMELITV